MNRMTNEEALKMFKTIIMAEIDRMPYHYDAKIGEDVYDSTSKVNELLQLNKIVSKALKKQIPKKPIVNDDIVCPNCSATLIYCLHTFEINHCDKCGQRLDWSKENDE